MARSLLCALPATVALVASPAGANPDSRTSVSLASRNMLEPRSTVAIAQDLAFEVPATPDWTFYSDDTRDEVLAASSGNPGAPALVVTPSFTGAVTCKGWRSPYAQSQPATRAAWPRAAAIVEELATLPETTSVAACFDTSAGALQIMLTTDHKSGAAAVDAVATKLVTSLVAAAARVLHPTQAHGTHDAAASIRIAALDLAMTLPASMWTLRSAAQANSTTLLLGADESSDVALGFFVDPRIRTCDDWLVSTSGSHYEQNAAFWPTRSATAGVFAFTGTASRSVYKGCLVTRRGPLVAVVMLGSDVEATRLADARALLEAVIAGASTSRAAFPKPPAGDTTTPDVTRGKLTLPLLDRALQAPRGATWSVSSATSSDILVMHGDGPAIEIRISPSPEPCAPSLPAGTARASWPRGIHPVVTPQPWGVEVASACLGAAQPVDVLVVSSKISTADAARIRAVLDQLAR